MTDTYKVGQLLITPGDTLAEMDNVSAGIRSLVKDTLAQDATDQFRKGLARFAVEWKNYREEHEGWWDRGLSGTYAKVQEYKERLNGWIADFQKLGKKPSAKTQKVKKSIIEETAKAGLKLADPSNLKWIGIGILGVGGIALGIYLTQGKQR